MTGTEPDPIRVELEEAFRREAPQAAADDVDAAARSIAAIASRSNPDRFYIGQDGSVAELKEAFKAVERLQRKLVALHGVTVAEVNVAAVSNHSIYASSVDGQLSRLRDDLGTARDRIARQGLLHLPPTSRAQHIAEAVAYRLVKLTGRLPGVSKDLQGRVKGPFVRLLSAAFKATGIGANVESEATKVAASWKRTHRRRDTLP